MRTAGRYDEHMASSPVRRDRVILIALLIIAVLVLVGVIAVMLPFLTSKSTGSSGQTLPQGYESEVEATGADGRTRTLSVTGPNGETIDTASVRPGESLTVTGSGFDASTGIYVAVCAMPANPETKPGPCLGGIPDGVQEGGAEVEMLTSVWITNDWAWSAFATQRYNGEEPGSFTTKLLVPAAQQEGLDCTVTKCAIATRADHTATNDRVQDLLIPLDFAGEQ